MEKTLYFTESELKEILKYVTTRKGLKEKIMQDTEAWLQQHGFEITQKLRAEILEDIPIPPLSKSHDFAIRVSIKRNFLRFTTIEFSNPAFLQKKEV